MPQTSPRDVGSRIQLGRVDPSGPAHVYVLLERYPMNTAVENSERQNRILRGWLLALLRFAVTLDNNDKLAIFAIAAEIDGLNSQTDRSSFRFFYKTTAELSKAIANPLHSNHPTILQRHLKRMKDERLKRAFAAALELEYCTTGLKTKPQRSKDIGDLWKGLRC